MAPTANINLKTVTLSALKGQMFWTSNNTHPITSSPNIPIVAIRRTMAHLGQIAECPQRGVSGQTVFLGKRTLRETPLTLS